MPRTEAEIQADIAARKAAGVHQSSREMRDLRAELAALSAPPVEPAPEVPSVSPVSVSGPVPALAASDDVTFVNDALAQLLLKGKGAGKIEQCYSDIRSLLGVKHIIEDAAGLTPTGRMELPHWSTLGRERDSGELFKPGENQLIVDGLAQRAIPAPKAVKPSRPVMTAPDGTPISFRRSRVLDEPEGDAQFVGEEVGSEE